MKEGKEPEISSMASAVEKKHPAGGLNVSEQISSALIKLKPVIDAISKGIDVSQPYISRGYAESCKAWEKLQPYNPDLLIPAFIGLVCVFASGVFPVTIAAVEAINTSGTWPGIKSSFVSLRANYDAAKTAYEKDNLTDADKDGVADVKKLNKQELAKRRGVVFLKSVNTEQVSDAFQQLGTALFAVLATLRLQFAYALTIGSSIAKLINEKIGSMAVDSVSSNLPEDCRRHAPFLVSTFFKVVGFFVAWSFTSYVAAFYGAMKGARIFAESTKKYLQHKNRLPSDHALVKHGGEISSGLGIFGFAFQCYMGLRLPMILSLILLPLIICEWMVGMFFGIFA